MDLGKLPLITMITARMAWLGQRQQVLALWEGVEIDQEVPETYYKAVAEVIGYVWRLKRKAAPRRRS
jgi:flagellar biosynthesis protein FlhB